MKLKIVAVLATLLLSVSPAVAQWEPGVWLPPSTHLGISLVEEIDVHQATSSAYVPSEKFNGSGAEKMCSVIDEDCANPRGSAVLGACQSELDNFCIESLTVTSSGGQARELTFSRYLDGNTFDVAAGLVYPAGKTQSLWIDEEGSGQLYTTDISVQFYTNLGKPALEGMSIGVYPTQINRDSKYLTPRPRIQSDGLMTSGAITVPGCNWTEDGVCGKPLDFTDEQEVSVSLRVGPMVSGFFFGRIGGATITSVPISNDATRLVISGSPMTVPGLSYSAPKDEYSDKAMQGLRSAFYFIEELLSGMTYYDAGGPRSTELVTALVDQVGNRASGERRVWSLGTGLWVERINPCLKSGSKITGILSTNAMAYNGNAPSFNGAFLDYKVAGMHYTSTGEKFTGTYDLAIRSEVARCLYGFSNAPVSATVTVVDEKGQPTIATTTVSESDGWLRLAAYGFSFSEKRIQAVLEQSTQKTLTSYVGNTTSLTNKQKLEIREMVGKTPKGGKFICTGIRYFSQPMSENIKVRARAKEACAYAKRLNPNLSFWYQTKTTQARSYSGKVLINTKVPTN